MDDSREDMDESIRLSSTFNRWYLWIRNKLNLSSFPQPQWVPLSTMNRDSEKTDVDIEKDHPEEDSDFYSRNELYINTGVFGVSLICLIIGSIFYLKSLVGGDVTWLHDNLPILARQMIISICFLYVGLLLLFIRRKNFKPVVWFPVVTVIFLVLWFEVLGRDLGATLAKHGLYNLAMFGAITILLLLYTLLWAVSLKYLGWKRAIIAHLLVYNIILLALVIKNKQLKQDWIEGIDGKELVNSGIGCNIPTDFVPYAAYLPEGWSNILGQSCPSIKHFATLENNILTITCDDPLSQYIERPNYLLSRPDTDKDQRDLRRYYGEVEVEKRFNYTGPVETYAESVEAICGSNSQVFMRNVKNEDVINRANVSRYPSQETGLSHPPNILVIYIDALSRAHAHRRLQKTMKTLEMIDESDDHNVYEFFKYHALGPHTGPNTVPMYTGSGDKGWPYPGDKDFLQPDKKTLPNRLWWRQFDDQYVKAWEYGTCEDWEKTYINGSQLPYSMDHTLIMPFCHPDAFPPGDPYGPINGPYGMRARCIGDKHVHSYLFDYTREYWSNYENIGKIAQLNFMEAHEGSLEVIAQVDDDLSDFLLSDEIQKEMDNTFVLLVADHGNHMSPFFIWTKGGIVENRLPMLFMITPKWFAERYPDFAKNLETNQERLVTSFDLYNTYMTLSTLPEFAQLSSTSPPSAKGFSPSPSATDPDLAGGLFRVVPEERTCDDAFVPESMCICNK